MSEQTVGYCGADIKALCTEAALISLRRQFPQIYLSANKLVIDVSKINISASDFHSALKAIVPTAQRSDVSFARALAEQVFPLLGVALQDVLSLCCFVFPPSWKCVNKAKESVTKMQQREDVRRTETQQLVKEIKESFRSRNRSSAGSESVSNGVSAWSSGLSSQKDRVTSVPRPTYTSTSGIKQTYGSSSGGCQRPLFPKDPFRLPYTSVQCSVSLTDVYFDLTNDMCFHDNQSEDDILERENYSPAEVTGSQLAKDCSSGQLTQLTSHPHVPPFVHRPRLLLAGPPGE